MKAAFIQWCIGFLRRSGYVVMLNEAPEGKSSPAASVSDTDWCIGFLQRTGYVVTPASQFEDLDDLRIKLASHKLDADRGRIESFLLLQKLRDDEGRC
jgi:hypothetical protein